MVRDTIARVMIVILLSSLPTLLLAQATNARLTGFVTDQSKALLSGVKVDAINADTNVHYGSTTNNEGSYTVTGLPPGDYKIEVGKPGFKSIIKTDVVLHLQDVVAINFT